MRGVNGMKYSVNQYLIYQLKDSEYVIQTDESIMVINNERMITFLKKLERLNSISSEKIADFFDNGEVAINYLEKNHILKRQETLNFDIKNAVFVTNNQRYYNFISSHIELDSVTLHKITWDSFLETNSFPRHTLFVFIINKYNPKTIKKLYEKVKTETTNYALVSFFYGYKYYLDNLYNAAFGNPNHFDHLGYIQSKVLNDDKTKTYQNIIDVVFDRDDNFNLEIPISYSTFIKSFNLLIMEVEKLFSLTHFKRALTTGDLLTVTCLDYKSNDIYKDTAMFWELNAYEE